MERPAKNAKKSAMILYLTRRGDRLGGSAVDLEGMTKADLAKLISEAPSIPTAP